MLNNHGLMLARLFSNRFNVQLWLGVLRRDDKLPTSPTDRIAVIESVCIFNDLERLCETVTRRTWSCFWAKLVFCSQVSQDPTKYLNFLSFLGISTKRPGPLLGSILRTVRSTERAAKFNSESKQSKSRPERPCLAMSNLFQITP